MSSSLQMVLERSRIPHVLSAQMAVEPRDKQNNSLELAIWCLELLQITCRSERPNRQSSCA